MHIAENEPYVCLLLYDLTRWAMRSRNSILINNSPPGILINNHPIVISDFILSLYFKSRVSVAHIAHTTS